MPVSAHSCKSRLYFPGLSPRVLVRQELEFLCHLVFVLVCSVLFCCWFFSEFPLDNGIMTVLKSSKLLMFFFFELSFFFIFMIVTITITITITTYYYHYYYYNYYYLLLTTIATVNAIIIIIIIIIIIPFHILILILIIAAVFGVFSLVSSSF